MKPTNDFSNGSIGHLLWRVALKWRVAVDRELKPLGLSHARYSTLASLYGMARAGVRPSQRQLAEYSGIEPMYISKLIRALEREGLVVRRVHPEDPRAVELSLTSRGERLVTKAISAVWRLQSRLLEPLGGPEGEPVQTFRTALQALLDGDAPDDQEPGDASGKAGRSGD